ncbi:MAG TPA: thioesterase family protein [Alphaproteobacteria bacterium]|nr:thioesterase family protein [Alphaproteobacteria bacterium]
MNWLDLHGEPVRPEWVDYNGHMSEAYYVLVFGHATDALLDLVGLDAAYRDANHRSLYTAEAHVRYLHEVKLGAALAIRTGVFAIDAKRVHFGHEMYVGGEAIATTELMGLHVDTAAGRTAPFDGNVRDRLAACTVDRPDWVGRSLGL